TMFVFLALPRYQNFQSVCAEGNVTVSTKTHILKPGNLFAFPTMMQELLSLKLGQSPCTTWPFQPGGTSALVAVSMQVIVVLNVPNPEFKERYCISAPAPIEILPCSQAPYSIIFTSYLYSGV